MQCQSIANHSQSFVVFRETNEDIAILCTRQMNWEIIKLGLTFCYTDGSPATKVSFETVGRPLLLVYASSIRGVKNIFLIVVILTFLLFDVPAFKMCSLYILNKRAIKVFELKPFYCGKYWLPMTSVGPGPASISNHGFLCETSTHILYLGSSWEAPWE